MTMHLCCVLGDSIRRPRLKFLRKEYARRGAEQFKRDWMLPNGEMGSLSFISDALTTRRKVEDRHWALMAREEFKGEAFASLFSWVGRPKSAGLICKKDSGVAKRYLMHKGLSSTTLPVDHDDRCTLCTLSP